MQNILKDVEARMAAAIDTLARELAAVRTGRASAALLEGIRVDYYGTPTPLAQMASVRLTPSNDGKAIRLTLPTPTEERRKQLAKSVGKIAEDSRVAIRNLRREANEKLKALAKDKQVSEDEERRGHDQIQKTTDKYIAKVDELLKKKEQEILTF